MATQKQIEANRRNSQKSTGPRTPEGKAAVRFNALTHGLTAPHALLPTEDPAAFDNLLRAFHRDLQPVGPLETSLVHKAADAWWRLRRARRYEADFINIRMAELNESAYHHHYNRADPASRPGYIVTRDSGSDATLMNLSLLESRLDRLFYGALHELERRQARRAGLPLPPPITGHLDLTLADPGQGHLKNQTQFPLAPAPPVACQFQLAPDKPPSLSQRFLVWLRSCGKLRRFVGAISLC